MPSWGKLLPSNCQGIFRRRHLAFVCSYSALPKEVSHLLWNSWPPRNCQIRRRGIHKWVKIGFSGDGLGRGLFNPSVFSSAPDQAHQGKWTLKVKGETVLVTWCSGSAVLTSRWKHASPPSPSGIWQVRLISSQLERRQNGNLSVIEWKYTENFVDRMKRKRKRRSEKVSKMEGSESKAIGVHD